MRAESGKLIARTCDLSTHQQHQFDYIANDGALDFHLFAGDHFYYRLSLERNAISESHNDTKTCGPSRSSSSAYKSSRLLTLRTFAFYSRLEIRFSFISASRKWTWNCMGWPHAGWTVEFRSFFFGGSAFFRVCSYIQTARRLANARSFTFRFNVYVTSFIYFIQVVVVWMRVYRVVPTYHKPHRPGILHLMFFFSFMRTRNVIFYNYIPNDFGSVYRQCSTELLIVKNDIQKKRSALFFGWFSREETTHARSLFQPMNAIKEAACGSESSHLSSHLALNKIQ